MTLALKLYKDLLKTRGGRDLWKGLESLSLDTMCILNFEACVYIIYSKTNKIQKHREKNHAIRMPIFKIYA